MGDIVKRQEVNLNTRDYAVLTSFFKVLTESGLVVDILKILAGNKITEPILVKGIVWFLSSQDLTDLLTAVDKSGLTVDIVLRALQDDKFFPGAYAIIDGLKNGQTTTPPSNSVNTIGLAQDMSQLAKSYNQFAGDGLGNVLSEIKGDLGIGESGGIFSFLNPVFSLVGLGTTGSDSDEELTLSPSATAAVSGGAANTASATNTASSSPSTSTPSSSPSSDSSSASSSSSGGKWWQNAWNTVSGWFNKRDSMIDEEPEVTLAKRDNEVLDQLVDSLAKSGLAMQVVVSIIEDPDNAPFARDLIKEIVREKVITLDQLKTSLDATNLLNDGVIGALKSPDLDITIT